MSMQSKLLPGKARSWLEKVPRVHEKEEKKAEEEEEEEEEEKTKSGIIERYGETGKGGGRAAGLQLNEEDTTHR